MRSLTPCQLLRRDNAARTHLVRSGVHQRRTAPAVTVSASATLIATVIAATAPARIHAVTTLPIAATVSLTLLRALRMRLGGLRPPFGLVAAFLIATVLAVATMFSVLASAVSAALFLLLLPLRRGLPAGYQLNQLSDKSKSHFGFLCKQRAAAA